MQICFHYALYKYKEFEVQLGIIEKVGKQGRLSILADIPVEHLILTSVYTHD